MTLPAASRGRALPGVRGRRLPPGPKGRLFQTLRYLRSPLAYTRAMLARYGDPFLMPSVNGRIVLTGDPELAREILAGREEDYVVGFGRRAVEPVAGSNSLLLLSGDRHRRERQVISPPFHGARMRAYAGIMRGAALRELARWRAGQQVVVQERMQRISLEVILRAVFGAQDEERVEAYRKLVRSGLAEVNPLPLFLPFLQREFGGLGPWARFQRLRREFLELLQQQIDEARAALAARPPDAEPPPDVLSRLLLARYEDGSALSDEALRDQLLTLVVAGHETTATALAWAVYELLRSPELLARTREEIGALGAEPAPEELGANRWLDAVAREALRLHPVVGEIFRTTARPREFAGYGLPAGVHLAASALVIHRNPELYPEPERFRPERFVERRFAPHEFLAFGGGHRHCVGSALALFEMKIVLGTLVARCDLELASPEPVRTVLRHLTFGPEGGVVVRVRRAAAVD